MKSTRMVKLQAAFTAGFLKKNIFESYFPFLANIINSLGKVNVASEEVATAFKERYRFDLPLTFIRSILSVGVQKGLFRYDKQYGRYYVVGDDVNRYRFDSAEFDELWGSLKAKFIAFMNSVELDVRNEDIDEILVRCIERHNDRVLSASDDEIVISDDPIEFVWDSFVVDIHNRDDKLYEFVAAVSLCNVIRDAEFFDGDARNKFAGMRIYLDTAIAFSLIGLDEEPRVTLSRFFVKQLQESGCHVLVFDHCKAEMERIVESANYWINRSDYRIDKASTVARIFFEKRLSEEEVVQVLENIEDMLLSYGVKVETSTYLMDENKFQQDEILLQELLEKKYAEAGRIIDDVRKKSVLVDIRSLIFVYRNRRGYVPCHLYDARCLMVTYNMVLNKTASEYSRKICHETIPACISVDIFSSALWLFSPVQICEYKKLQLLSDCYAATNPNKELLKKFVAALEEARRKGVIDEKKFILYKTSSLIRRPLAIAANGSNFTEETAMEIVKRMEDEGRFKTESKINEVKKAASEKLEEQRVAAENELKRVKEAMSRDISDKDMKILQEKARATESELHAQEMERLVDSTNIINQKIIDFIAACLAFIALFPLLTILLGGLLILIDTWKMSWQLSGIQLWWLSGVVAVIVDIFMVACKRVRSILKVPFRKVVQRLFT